MRFLRLGVLVGVCLMAGWLLTRSSVFRLRTVEVRAEDPSLAKDLERRLLFLHGKDLYRLSLSEIQRTILEEPRVRKAFLRRLWPSGLRIEIQERPVVGLLFRDDGRLWMVDEHGVVFAPLARPVGRPLLIGFTGVNDRLGEVTAWVEHLRSREFTSLEIDRLNEIEWRKDQGLVVRSLEEDLEIELGFSNFHRGIDNVDKALTMLKARKQRANVLDASYVRRVVLKARENLQNPPFGLNLKELKESSLTGTESVPAVR